MSFPMEIKGRIVQIDGIDDYGPFICGTFGPDPMIPKNVVFQPTQNEFRNVHFFDGIKIDRPQVIFTDNCVSIEYIQAQDSKVQSDGTCRTCGAPRKAHKACDYCQS